MIYCYPSTLYESLIPKTVRGVRTAYFTNVKAFLYTVSIEYFTNVMGCCLVMLSNVKERVYIVSSCMVWFCVVMLYRYAFMVVARQL